MAQATFSVRMDENLKIEFETLCNYLGMNMATAINMFARTVVKEKRIPFAITAADVYSRENARKAFDTLRKQAMDNGVSELSMEEIDEEIARARNGLE